MTVQTNRKSGMLRLALAALLLVGSQATAVQAQWSPGDPARFLNAPQVLDDTDNVAMGTLTPGSVTPIDLIDGFKISGTTFLFTADAADVGKTLRLTWFATRDGGVTSLKTLQSVTHLSGTVTWSAGMTLIDNPSGASLLSTTTAATALGGGDTSTVGTSSSAMLGASAITSGLPFSVTAESLALFTPDTLDDTATIRQSFSFYFTPSAPGATIELDLPSSAGSQLVVAAPEPASLAFLAIGGFSCFFILRRKPNS